MVGFDVPGWCLLLLFESGLITADPANAIHPPPHPIATSPPPHTHAHIHTRTQHSWAPMTAGTSFYRWYYSFIIHYKSFLNSFFFFYYFFFWFFSCPQCSQAASDKDDGWGRTLAPAKTGSFLGAERYWGMGGVRGRRRWRGGSRGGIMM